MRLHNFVKKQLFNCPWRVIFLENCVTIIRMPLNQLKKVFDQIEKRYSQ